MHEYLLNQQRRKEEYWLRKYGKVLQSAPVHPPKPVKEKSQPNMLPPINHGPRPRGGMGMGKGAAVFNAQGPIPSFPMPGSLPNPDRRHNADIPYHPAAPTHLPPLSHSPTNDQASKQSDRRGGDDQGMFMGPGREPSFGSPQSNGSPINSYGNVGGVQQGYGDEDFTQQPPHMQQLMAQQRHSPDVEGPVGVSKGYGKM